MYRTVLLVILSLLGGVAQAQSGLSTTLRSIFGGTPAAEPAAAPAPAPAAKPPEPVLTLKPAALPTAPASAAPAAAAPSAPAPAASMPTPAVVAAPAAAAPLTTNAAVLAPEVISVALPTSPAPAGLSMVLLPPGGPVTAQFANSAGHPAQILVQIDDAALQNAMIRFTFETLYVRTGVPQWDADLRSRPWFDPRGHARASFTANGARLMAPGEYEAQGTLSIKGYARTVTARIRVAQSGAMRVVQGEIPFMRADFRLGEAQWSDPTLMAANAAFRFRLESGVGND